MKTITSLFLLLFTVGAIAQTPCVDGFADGYPCNNVSLISHMTIDEIGGATGLNDIWGWTDSLYCKEYALVGKENGTAFVDITDALNPCYIGTLPTHTGNSTWRDIKVFKDYAFIVSEAGDHGMQVFDLTRLRSVVNPPITFDEDAHFDGFGNSHNIALNPESGYAYPIGTSFFAGGPHFINVNDPLNPTAAGGYDASGYSHDAQIINYIGPDQEHQGKEIFLGANGYDGKIVIVDITDKSDPELLGEGTYENSVYAHQGWITQDHRYFLHNDEIDEATFDFNTRTRVWDVSDLDNPIELPYFSSEISSTDHNHYIKGDYVFQSNYTGGLRILDISEIASNNIFETAFFDVHPNDDNNGYSGTWSNYPYFASGNVILTHRQGGLFIVKPEDAAILNASHPVYSKTCDGVIGGGDSMTSVCTPLSVTEEVNAMFSFSPNPASNVINITSLEAINSIEVLDITGKVIINKANNTNNILSTQLDISTLQSGLYVIRVNGSQLGGQKLIVE